MAGGEGTRLRPLTSNQPKPMVPVAGKPCMEYILELLKRHGVEEAVATLAFLPRIIRDYFGDGSTLGVRMRYSVEHVPAGTAGSVKLAEDHLRDDTFVVISGDALTDFDLQDIVAFHKRRGAMVTIALKHVENPLDFGIVVVNDEGRIERFLEKPTWGQVFSDTVNTGIYVLEPEVFDHIPAGEPFDFSQELFPKLFDMGAPLYGYVADGYWQDIGSLEQYLSANCDVLDGKLEAAIPGIELENRVFIGDNINLDSLENVTGPAYIGNYAKISPQAHVGAYSVLGSNVVVKEHAETRHSVIDANTYIGASSKVLGTIVGKNCDIKSGVTLSEGVALGDECVIGEGATIAPDVKVYPFKSVESGAQINSSIIWESRGTSHLFGKEGVVGLINVDVTAELALKLAMAYGTTLPKGARVTTSRDAHPASRVFKRALICGLNSTGVVVRDLRVASAAINRFEVKNGNTQGGMHVRISPWDPEMVQIQVFEPPGVTISEKRQKDIEKYYGRQDFRRAFYSEFGEIQFPDRAMEIYVRGLTRNLDIERIRDRAFRLVIDYSYSAASLILPNILGSLNAEILSVRAFSDQRYTTISAEELGENINEVRRLVTVMGADMGLVISPGGERLFVVDERGEEVSVEKTLLLLVQLVAQQAGKGAKIVLPLTVTRVAEALAEPHDVEIVRSKVSMPAFTRAASEDGVVFAGALGGGYVFPRFLPAFDAVMSLGKLLELLAPQTRSLGELVAEIPSSTLVHRTVPCPWSLKGTVMRVATERLQHLVEAEGASLAASGGVGESDNDEPLEPEAGGTGGERDPASISLIDGITMHRGDSWAQLLPDADEPVFHIYAEGADERESLDLAERFVAEVRTVLDEASR
jgi:mannose-1-phosphate guanylyltransferase/phosphomannomutase